MWKAAPVFAVALGVLTGGGCRKETETLVLVELTASPADAQLEIVSIRVSSATHPSSVVTQTFTLTNGLSASKVTYGVYLPSSIGGAVDLQATASEPGGACYLGTAGPVPQADSTTTASVALEPGTDCGAGGTGGIGGTGGSTGGGGSTGSGGTGGSTGSGGTSGSTGSGGTGGGGTVITACTEYDHRANPSAACNAGTGDATDVEITDLAFTPDGKLLFSAGADGRVKVWTWTGATLAATAQELTLNPGFISLAVSSDNKLVAAGGVGGQITIWNIGPWTVAASLTGVLDDPHTGKAADINGVAFGPNYTLYAVDGSGNLYVYTFSSVAPKSTITLRDYALVVGTSPIASDGTYWLAIGYEDGDASVTGVSAAGTLGTEVPFTVSPNISGIYTIRFSPNGKLLVSGSDDGSFGIWNIPLPASGAPRSPAVAPNTDFIWNAGFDPTSTYVVTAAGSSSANSQLAVWSVATGAMKSRTTPTAFSWPPRSVAFSPDGAALVTGEHNCGKLAVCAY